MKMKESNFPNLSVVNSLAEDAHTIPRDSYLPSAQGSLEQRRCGICSMDFPTIAAKVRHRVSLHRGQMQQAELINLNSAKIDQVQKIVQRGGGSSSEFLCVLKSGEVEWRTMPLDCAPVQELFLCAGDEENFLLLDRWVEGFRLVDMYETDDEDVDMEEPNIAVDDNEMSDDDN
jgi:hypothetical protein